jgi:hypothetical protein
VMDTRRSGVVIPDNPAENRQLPGQQAANPAVEKQEWVRLHAGHMHQCWLRWQTPLGVAPSYVAKLERDLARCYDQPLLRSFIERTY